MTLIAPGHCRHCGCAGEACTTRDGEKCTLDLRALACNGPGCEKAEAERQARIQREASAARAARTKPKTDYAELAARGWGHGAIVDELRRRERRRKGRAA